MKVKYTLGLLTALILTVAPVLAQEPTPAPPEPPEEFGNTFSLLINGGGFLGVYGEDINNENMGRYRLNQARGVGVTQVMQNSPAEKAGLRKDDVILRLDGENVTSVRKLNRLVSEIAPDHSVRITISRNGAEQELSATIGRRNDSNTVRRLLRPESRVWKWEGPHIEPGDLFDQHKNLLNNNGDLMFTLSNSRRIGVSTMQLTKQLADYFGITGGRGVLVTAVTDDGPAAKSGVKAGDVITAIDGEEIDSPGDISRVIGKKKEGDVTLTVIRNKSQQTIRVTPREGSGFSGSFVRPQVGRRIVIPRIQFPDVDVAMPQIQIPVVPAISIPVMPAININVPRVRVTPRIRLSRGVYGPI